MCASDRARVPQTARRKVGVWPASHELMCARRIMGTQGGSRVGDGVCDAGGCVAQQMHRARPPPPPPKRWEAPMVAAWGIAWLTASHTGAEAVSSALQNRRGIPPPPPGLRRHFVSSSGRVFSHSVCIRWYIAPTTSDIQAVPFAGKLQACKCLRHSPHRRDVDQSCFEGQVRRIANMQMRRRRAWSHPTARLGAGERKAGSPPACPLDGARARVTGQTVCGFRRVRLLFAHRIP